jgi:hypothetical protein
MDSDFDRAEESRERNEGLYYDEYHERVSSGGLCELCGEPLSDHLDGGRTAAVQTCPTLNELEDEEEEE